MENIKDISIKKELEKSFIDYAMSVIVSRAIPSVFDGLKPVQRRILYAMSTLDMYHNKKFRKSAHVVGTVLAKYHPHGDSAAYEAMVRMAQTFSLRYPLVWGQGNFGSIDGDSAAAMRYTEVKLSKLSSYLLSDIKKDTVSYISNYDETEKEPVVLPSRVPNLLINGSIGIAVGMATSIPPHNLREIIDGIIHYGKFLIEESTEKYDVNELYQIVKGPDFPTAGIVVNQNDMKEIYKNGKGRIIMRSKIDFEESSKGASRIIVKEIPYMVNKSLLIERIAELVKNKVIDSITDLTDESNRKGIRVVITLKRGSIPEVELNKLYKLTQLQSNFSVNMVALVEGKPTKLNLFKALQLFLNQRVNILVRKIKFLLEKSENRIHILQGLDKALSNINLLIRLIKNSNSTEEASKSIRKEFNLTKIQAQAILEMKLQRITKLERESLKKEIKEIEGVIKGYKLILKSKKNQLNEVLIDLNDINDKFGDDRRTELQTIVSAQKGINEEDLIERKNVIITLSNNGYVKRIPVDEYKIQNRGGKGSKGATIYNDDFVNKIVHSNTHSDLLFFTNYGKIFRVRAFKIPEFSKISKGVPIINILDIDSKNGEKIKSILSISDYSKGSLLFVTSLGLVKKTLVKHFKRVNRNGKKAITLPKKSELLDVYQLSSKRGHVFLATAAGKLVKFKSGQLRDSGRIAMGVKGINLGGSKLVGHGVTNASHEDRFVFSISERGFGKLTGVDDYRETKRGAKGTITMKVSLSGKLVNLSIVKKDQEVMIITNKGIVIRFALNKFSVISRNTKGVRIINLKKGEKISSIAVIDKEDNDQS